MATWKEKYNKKYDYPKSESHSLSDISKDTGISEKGLQQIYNKGIGAYKTNPQSVRPTVTSKEQWAMARVYSSVMGGKASKVDAKELKMQMGGSTDNFDRTNYYKSYYERLSPSNFVVEKENGKITINMNDRYKSGGRIFPQQAVMHDGIDEVDAKELKMQMGGFENLDMSLKNDKVSMDVPLLIRMLEYAKEDAKNDVELHKIAERLITLSQNKTLTMDDYEKIITKYRIGGRVFPQQSVSLDGIDEVDAIANGMFEKGGETDFNPDGKIKDKIVHASGDVGGMLVGKRHSNGGIKAINKSTGQPLEMEGGEVVITRDAVSDNKKRSFNGKMMTNRQILSAINESGGGVSFADGGQVPNDVQFDCNAEYEYGGKTMCGKDLAYALGGVTTAIVTDPNEAMADLQSTYGFDDVYAKGGTIECGSCDWSWDRKDGGDDMYVCHRCGTDNTEKYKDTELFDDAELFDEAREELGEEYLEKLDKFAEGGQLQTDEFPIDIDEATFVKDLGGSTGAKLYEYKGKQFVLKLGATSGQSYDEFLANQVYHLLDVPVPRSTFVGGSVVKEFIGKEEDVDYDNSIQVKKILRGYVADALLGNWDIYKNDNIILKEGTRTPFRIDSGGSLRYRARGEKKDNFGTEVFELQTLKDNNPKIKPYITDTVIKKGIEKIIEEKENILDLFKDDGIFRKKMEGRISYLEEVLNEINDRRGTDFVDEDVKEEVKEVVEAKEPSFEEKFLLDKISELRKRYEIKKRYLSEIQKGIALRDIRKYEIALDEIRLNNTSFGTLLENFINSTTVEFGDINEKRTLRKGKSINGEKSELTKKEYDAVRSESFINWFGDWELANETGNYEGVSKIINSETKEPLVVYHGTDTKFISWETYATNNLHYFAKKKRFADFFATSWQQRTDSAGVDSASIKADNPIKGTFVYSCFLDIKNPIDFTPFGIDKVPFNDYLKYLEVKYDLDLSKIEGYNDLKDRTEKVYSWVVIRKWQQFNLFVKNNTPYDGFSFYEFIPDSQRRGFEDASLSFTAFNSNQIKFTNNKSFSKFTDDSRLEIGGIIF